MMIKEDEVWGITLKGKDEIIGTIGLHVRNFENALKNQKELGYVIDDLYWGKGIVLEASKAVLSYAFLDLSLDQVIVGHQLKNDQSRRVIEKLKFRYTHVETRDHYDKSKIEIKMYEMKKEEFI